MAIWGNEIDTFVQKAFLSKRLLGPCTGQYQTMISMHVILEFKIVVNGSFRGTSDHYI